MVDQSGCSLRKRSFCKIIEKMDVKYLDHFSCALLLFFFSLVALFIESLWVGVLSALIVDIYILFILVIVAGLSDGKFKCAKDFLPTRVEAIFIIFILLVSLICGFGAMYLNTGSISNDGVTLTGTWEALYFSFVTITTLGYGDFSPSGSAGQIIVVFQLFSGFLLIFCIFPLVISRISMLESD